MNERGVIRNRLFKQQIVDFGGLRFGTITPTDLDAFMDFNNKLFVFVEAKYAGAPVPYGQRLAIERLCDACHQPPARYAVAFLTSHNDKGDINFAQTTVTKYRWQGQWLDPRLPGSTLVDGVKAFRDKYIGNVIPFPKADMRDEWLREFDGVT